MQPADALVIARDAMPDYTPPADAIEDEALPVGKMIAIKPNDYGQKKPSVKLCGQQRKLWRLSAQTNKSAMYWCDIRVSVICLRKEINGSTGGKARLGQRAGRLRGR